MVPVLLHSELVDQVGLAGLRGAHERLPGLQPAFKYLKNDIDRRAMVINE